MNRINREFNERNFSNHHARDLLKVLLFNKL